MKCSSCGTKNKASSKTCVNCNASLIKSKTKKKKVVLKSTISIFILASILIIYSFFVPYLQLIKASTYRNTLPEEMPDLETFLAASPYYYVPVDVPGELNEQYSKYMSILIRDSISAAGFIMDTYYEAKNDIDNIIEILITIMEECDDELGTHYLTENQIADNIGNLYLYMVISEIEYESIKIKDYGHSLVNSNVIADKIFTAIEVGEGAALVSEASAYLAKFLIANHKDTTNDNIKEMINNLEEVCLESNYYLEIYKMYYYAEAIGELIEYINIASSTLALENIKFVEKQLPKLVNNLRVFRENDDVDQEMKDLLELGIYDIANSLYFAKPYLQEYLDTVEVDEDSSYYIFENNNPFVLTAYASDKNNWGKSLDPQKYVNEKLSLLPLDLTIKMVAPDLPKVDLKEDTGSISATPWNQRWYNLKGDTIRAKEKVQDEVIDMRKGIKASQDLSKAAGTWVGDGIEGVGASGINYVFGTDLKSSGTLASICSFTVSTAAGSFTDNLDAGLALVDRNATEEDRVNAMTTLTLNFGAAGLGGVLKKTLNSAGGSKAISIIKKAVTSSSSKTKKAREVALALLKKTKDTSLSKNLVKSMDALKNNRVTKFIKNSNEKLSNYKSLNAVKEFVGGNIKSAVENKGKELFVDFIVGEKERLTPTEKDNSVFENENDKLNQAEDDDQTALEEEIAQEIEDETDISVETEEETSISEYIENQLNQYQQPEEYSGEHLFYWTPELPIVGMPVMFNAGIGFENGIDTDYYWNFGGVEEVHKSNDGTATFTFNQPGKYAVGLLLEENDPELEGWAQLTWEETIYIEVIDLNLFGTWVATHVSFVLDGTRILEPIPKESIVITVTFNRDGTGIASPGGAFTFDVLSNGDSGYNLFIYQGGNQSIFGYDGSNRIYFQAEEAEDAYTILEKVN